MPTRTAEERAASRAEARRRARLAARGEAPELEVEPDTSPAPAERRGMFERLFPPAPPLPNRTDPLAKFDRSGPLRPVRERLYLLRKNLLAWMLPSLACFVGYFASLTGQGSVIGLVGTFLTFGSLIAAGWYGWQRPTLYGTVTALIAFAIVWFVLLAAFAEQGAGPTTFGTPLELVGAFAFQGLVQGGLGFLGGWYGGYLRRRQAQVTAESRAAAGRRRG
jgi:hypothetical protein